MLDAPLVNLNKEKSFIKKIPGQWSLVTLERGTCSYRAAEHFAQSAFETVPQLIEVSSFSEAVNQASGNKRILLLPHIHPIVGDVETSYKWQSMGDYIFRLNNPPIYLARDSKPGGVNGKCAALGRLKTLVNTKADSIEQWVEAETTQQAARMCADGDAEFCITNEYGLDKYKLDAVRELKKMEICWHPYQFTGR